MPINPIYKGAYVYEVPSGVHTITGVATSITAFIGRALKGPCNIPTMIHNFADYEHQFGGLWQESTMSYAVDQYFSNGGKDALIVRVAKNATKATIDVPCNNGTCSFQLEAANEGNWGNALKTVVDYNTKESALPNLPRLFPCLILLSRNESLPIQNR